MIWLCIGALIIAILWFVCMTPWPFVLLLRHKKEEVIKNKSRNI